MRKRKINWLKLVSFIIGIVTLLYFTISTISYTAKTTEAVKNYEPQERTIIIK